MLTVLDEYTREALCVSVGITSGSTARRREVLNAEWFTSSDQARVVITQWLRRYNHTRPHQALNMRSTGARNSTSTWSITRGLDRTLESVLESLQKVGAENQTFGLISHDPLVQ